jgi:prepilin-type processing-associated H-X9-DG protein
MNSAHCPFERNRAPRLVGFTLVELLVVIGIITILIGILLPSLSAARQSAQRTACAAKLQQIMIAANIHVVDHKGFYPLAGELSGNIALDGTTVGGITPQSLSDYYVSNYTWMGYTPLAGLTGSSDIRCLAPITYALGSEMGYKRNLGAMNDTDQAAASADALGVSRHFLCPSQATDVSEMHQLCFLYGGIDSSDLLLGWTDFSSYVFNEAVLGFDDNYGRLRGQASKVRQPSKTLFACDGLGGSTLARGITAAFRTINNPPPQYPPPWPFLTFYNNNYNFSYAPITLSDALTGRTGGPGNHRLAGDAASFDQIRHRGKMNIAFCDGHVELRDIPPFTLNSQKTAATMRNDPTAKGLANVYLIAN